MDLRTDLADKVLGRLLIARGVLQEAEVQECLQRRQQDPSIAFSELLIEGNYLTADQIRETLLAAETVSVLHCPRCSVQVCVERQPGVVVQHCRRCESPLVQPPGPHDSDAAIASASVDPLPAEVAHLWKDTTRRFGKYIIVSELGAGAMAKVYKAWDRYLSQYVALKRARSPEDKGAGTTRVMRIQSLLTEARSALLLRHPHIVTIYDIGRVDGELYISMEFLEGRTLSEECAALRSPDVISPLYTEPRKYIRYLRDLARALHYAHTRAKPVVHCDVKPSNVFLAQDNRAVLLDFGLGRSLHALSRDGTTIAGSPSFMAPEQAAGRSDEIDARTDIYGLGAVMYDLLAGRPPFVGAVDEVVNRVMTEAPPAPVPLSGAAEASPAGRYLAPLEQICLRCMDRDRSGRYPTARHLAEDLDRLLLRATTVSRTRAMLLPPPPAPLDERVALPVSAVKRPTLLPILVSVAVLFGFALGSALWLGSQKRTAPAAEEDLLGACRAELASASDEDSRRRLEDEMACITATLRRLVSAVDRERTHWPTFRLRRGTLEDAQVLKGTSDSVVLFHGGQVLTVSWADVTAEQVLDLAERCFQTRVPEDDLGLALYARRAGLNRRAEAFFERLRGTPLDATARSYGR
ncbi:MAG: serine/threonine protein kinase [Planctomycetes bacterium]|nr:serine/threonine protein kinase [Planctomycetota bacterium]